MRTDSASGAGPLAGGEIVAYSAVCTPQGCTVGYDPLRKLLVYPYDGSFFGTARAARMHSSSMTQPREDLQVPDTVRIVDGTRGGGSWVAWMNAICRYG